MSLGVREGSIRRMLPRLPLYALLAGFLLAGCPTPEPEPDDDDSGDDDDSAGSGDDDDGADTCSAAAGPYDLELTGGQNMTLAGMEIDCSDFGGDTWQIRITDPNWVLRITTGPLISGEPISQGVSLTLLEQGNIDHTYAGNVATGHVAAVTAEAYDGGPPCGTWTSDPLPNTSAAGGADVTLGPQPFPFRCPE